MVARSLWIKETGSFSYTGVVIEVPDDSPGYALSIYLTVTLCPASSTCAPGAGPAVLLVKAAFVDADPATPAAGKRQVVILSWTRPG